MEDSRYPKICFNKLKKLAEHDLSSPKFNWFVQVNEYFFNKIKESDIWLNITLEKLTTEKNNLLTKIKNYLLKEDQEFCEKSNSLIFYPSSLNNGINSGYLNLKIPSYDKKVIAQLRMYNTYVQRIILKKKIQSKQTTMNIVNTVMKEMISCI